MDRARIITTVGLGLALSFSVGCKSRITGNEGNFQFSYASDDRIGDFNKPIAVGAFLDLEVVDVGAQRPVDLTSATTDDETILTVTSFSGNQLTVQGVGDGNVLLSVEGTTAEGETLPDSVNLLVRVPEVLKLWHTCVAAGADAAYLTDATIRVPYDMEMDNGQPVIGYGYYPATSSDPSALTFDEAQSGQVFLAFSTGADAADVTIDSDIDDTSLPVKIITEAEIDGVAEPALTSLDRELDVGNTLPFYVRPKVGGAVVCQANTTKTVQSDTPDICDVRDAEPASDEDELKYEFGWFEIEGKAEGECLYTVTFTDGNGGAGVSAQFSHTIAP